MRTQQHAHQCLGRPGVLGGAAGRSHLLAPAPARPLRARSWRQYPALQQPEYPDAQAVQQTFKELAEMPPLIFAGECRTLQSRLAKAAVGEVRAPRPFLPLRQQRNT